MLCRKAHLQVSFVRWAKAHPTFLRGFGTQTSAGIKYGVPGISKGLLMYFGQRGAILTLREFWSLIRNHINIVSTEYHCDCFSCFEIRYNAIGDQMTRDEKSKPKYLYWPIAVALFIVLCYLFSKYICPDYPPPAY
jgi:hypothetical protein